LLVNRHQMVQVFQNLLANALKFRGARIPRIRVSAEETGDTVRVLFEDNGIGFDARDAERIFGMFQRLHNEREYPGIGVGLAICRQIVQAHGGDIFVDSTPGRGSCFTIEFKGAALRSVISRSHRNGILA
jgi:signal transduction histidine kinase